MNVSAYESPTPTLLLVVFDTLLCRSNGETKKFSVGVLQLNTEVVHYIVPSKEPAAYLQAKVRTT